MEKLVGNMACVPRRTIIIKYNHSTKLLTMLVSESKNMLLLHVIV